MRLNFLFFSKFKLQTIFIYIVFARCRDPEELWVPFVEKAYAKLHGSYDSLIGGYTDYALRDCTGFISEHLVLKSSYDGYHSSTGESIENNTVRK